MDTFQTTQNQNISPPVDQPTDITVSPQPEDKKGEKSLKVILYILICFALLSTGAFGFWLYQEKIAKEIKPSPAPLVLPSPISSPTPITKPGAIPADWKTYKNEKYGFELRYPSYMSMENKRILPSAGLVADISFGQHIWLTIRDPKLNEKEVTKNWKSFETFYIKELKILKNTSQSSSIGDNSPYLTHIQYLINLPTATVFITYREQFEGEYEKFSQTLDQILSTFKFLNY